MPPSRRSSDPTRRGILERLGERDASISELAAAFGMTLTGMKKHVRGPRAGGAGDHREGRPGARSAGSARAGSTTRRSGSPRTGGCWKRGSTVSATSWSGRKDRSHEHTTEEDRARAVGHAARDDPRPARDPHRARLRRAARPRVARVHRAGRCSRSGGAAATSSTSSASRWSAAATGASSSTARRAAHGFEGRYREVTPPERIVQTFEWDGMPGYTVRRTRRRSRTSATAARGSSRRRCSTPREERDGMLQLRHGAAA